MSTLSPLKLVLSIVIPDDGGDIGENEKSQAKGSVTLLPPLRG